MRAEQHSYLASVSASRCEPFLVSEGLPCRAQPLEQQARDANDQCKIQQERCEAPSGNQLDIVIVGAHEIPPWRLPASSTQSNSESLMIRRPGSFMLGANIRNLSQRCCLARFSPIECAC